MSVSYLATTPWRVEHMTGADHRAMDLATGHAVSGLSRRVRQLLQRSTARARRTPVPRPAAAGREGTALTTG